MDATTNALAIRDALSVLKRYTGRPLSPGAELVELATHGSGSLTLRRWNGTEASASLAADGPLTVGTVHVPADALANAIGKAKGTVRLTAADGTLTVTTDGGTGTVRIGDAQDFPAPDRNDYVPLATITATECSRVATVAKAAANGIDARAVLTSVAISANGDGSGEAVATDTYRMHVARIATVSGSPEDVTIIPADVMRIATKGATDGAYVSVTAEGKRFAVAYTSTKGPKRAPRVVHYRVTGATYEGPYPNYRTLLPDPDAISARWTVGDAKGTADAIGAFANKVNFPAIMEPAGSAVRVTASFADGTELEAVAPMRPDADAIGEDASIAFNPAYFRDALTHAGDGATVALREASKAALIEGDGSYALLMPMRVR